MLVIEVINLVCGFIGCFAAKVPKQVVVYAINVSALTRRKSHRSPFSDRP